MIKKHIYLSNQKAVVASKYKLFSPFLGANGLTDHDMLYPITTFTPWAFIFGRGTAPFRMHCGVQADAQRRPKVSGERLATIDWGLYGLNDDKENEPWMTPDNTW